MAIFVSCFVLVLASVLAFCEQKPKATGYFRYTCIRGSEFEIKLNMPDGKTAEFHFIIEPDKNAIKDPVIAWAEVCESAGHCKKGKAAVVFQHVPKKKASGKFTIEFDDGRKEEGSFEAVHQKQSKLICE